MLPESVSPVHAVAGIMEFYGGASRSITNRWHLEPKNRGDKHA